jgi:hypothetical protein
MHFDARRGGRSVNQATHRDAGLARAGEARTAELPAVKISDLCRAQLSRWRANTKRLKLRIDPQT